jgi:hypothetical protein
MERVERGIPKGGLLLNIRNLNPRQFAFLHQREKIRDLVLLFITEEVPNSLDPCHGLGFNL